MYLVKFSPILHAASARDDDLGGGEFRPFELRQFFADERRYAGIGRGGDSFDRRADRPRRLRWNAAVRTVMTFLGLGRFDGLDRVAGIDRPLEGVRRNHLGDVGDLHDVEQRRHARQDVLAGRGGGRDDRVIVAGERHDQRRDRLGQQVRIERAHRRAAPFLTPSSLAAASATALQSWPATSTCTSPPSCVRRGQRLGGGVASASCCRVRQREASAITAPPLRSSVCRPVRRLATLMPALRFAGSTVFSTLQPRRRHRRRRSAGVFSSIGFFFAFMMLGSEA